MDTYAAGIAELVESLDLKGSVHIGHSTGGGEVTRYVARHGAGRVVKAVLISAIPPTFMKSATNPDGVPKEVVDDIHNGTAYHSFTKTSRSRSTASTVLARSSPKEFERTGGARE
jgi:non-heme chloroperoxidase